jgi:hypothetical protein
VAAWFRGGSYRGFTNCVAYREIETGATSATGDNCKDGESAPEIYRFRIDCGFEIRPIKQVKFSERSKSPRTVSIVSPPIGRTRGGEFNAPGSEL